MKKLLQTLIAVFAIILLATSCQYKAIIEPVVPPPDPNDTVYYAQQIEPIFTEQNCTSCHPGSAQPDLTAGNSYNSITGMGLVNTTEPDVSRIYTYPLPEGNHYVKYTSSQAALILVWIEQGALDN